MNGTSHAADFDVVIGGGGLVGATLALALAELDLRVALIEASAFDDPGQPSFDDRTTALSNGSRRAFEALGVWQLIEHEATPIRRIHVSDQGRFGFARLAHGQFGGGGDEAVQDVIDFGLARQAGLGEVDGGKRPGGDEPARFGDRQESGIAAHRGPPVGSNVRG